MTKVLLVDDNGSNRVTLGLLLEDEGLQVELAGSLAEGREALCRHGASYDLVLLDLHLGDGLGTKLVPIARDKMPGARVMLISGSVGEHEVPREVGFDGVLQRGQLR